MYIFWSVHEKWQNQETQTGQFGDVLIITVGIFDFDVFNVSI